MRGGNNEIQKIETGTRNIQLINMLEKPKERQSPYKLYGTGRNKIRTGRIRGSGTAYALC